MKTAKDYFVDPRVPLYAHLMNWWGRAPHLREYRSDDPATVQRQFAELRGWGFDGVIVDWYGDTIAKQKIVNRATAMWLALAERGDSFKLAVTIDVGAIKDRVDQTVTPTDEFIDLMRGVYALFASSPAYLRINDRPVVFEFGMETLPRIGQAPIDWAIVMSEYPESLFIHRNIGGFDTPGAGSYAWIDSGLPYLKDYYNRAITPSQTKLCFGSIFKGFDNRKRDDDGDVIQPVQAVWPGATVKVIPEDDGRTFLSTIRYTNDFMAAGGMLAGVVCNTYNDREEGTDVEGGISCGLSGNLDALLYPPALKPMFKL